MNARRPSDSAGDRISLGGASLPQNARRNGKTQNSLRKVVCQCPGCVVKRPSHRCRAGCEACAAVARWSGEEDWKMTPVSLVPLKKESHWSVLLDTAIMLLALALAIGALYALG